MLPLKNCRITSIYGIERTINGKTSVHKGIDFVSDSGDLEVKAIAPGVLRGNFQDPNGYGNYTSIEHTDGTRALYCHLKSFKRKAGDMIKEGDVIGIEGTSGNSTGVHLHLEIRETPYLQHNHINVAQYMGIRNEVGLVKDSKTKEEQMEFIKKKAGLDDNTMKYLDFYRYNDELIKKLAKAMK